MASSSGRKSGSSGGSAKRKRVVIGADETVRVRYKKNQPEVEAERKRPSRTSQRAEGERAGARVPRPSSAGLKVASEKRDERDRRRRETARRRLLLGVAIVAIATVVAWGLMALWQAPLFTVDTVRVQGNSHLTTAQVLALAAVPSEATLLRLPAGEISERVAASPWVDSVSLTRSFPHTLVIGVTERKPVAVVDTGPRGLWLVSADAHWMVQRSREPTAGLTLIKDIPNLAPQAGIEASSDVLVNALAVASGLSPQLRAQLRYVSAPTIEKTMLVLKNAVQVFVGSADQIGKKDLITRAILGKEKNVVYVNVRVTDRPTWRGLTGNQ